MLTAWPGEVVVTAAGRRRGRAVARRGHAAAPSWPSEAEAGQREGLRACGGRVQARRRGQAKLKWGHQGGVAGMRQRRLGAASSSIMAW